MNIGPIVVIDVETTSIDTKRAEILELAVRDFETGEQYTWRFRPRGPIDPGAQKVHGITMEHVVDCGTFDEANPRSPGNKGFLHDDCPGAVLGRAKVIVGYNLDFDLRVLDAELGRLGVTWARSTMGVLVVDAYRLWQVQEKRRLVDAVDRFLGVTHDTAHTAAGDVAATDEVLRAMVSHFGLDDGNVGVFDWMRLAEACDPNRRLRLGSNHFVWRDGRVTVNFGKYCGTDLTKVDVGFLSWMLRNDFPPEAREVAERVRSTTEQEFYDWVVKRWPPPMADDVVP